MDPLKKVTAERDSLLAEIRRLRKEAALHLAGPDQKSLNRLRKQLEQAAPSHLFVKRNESKGLLTREEYLEKRGREEGGAR